MAKKFKYILYLLTILATGFMYSCSDDDLPIGPDNPNEGVEGEGDVITFSITLDKMGGVTSRAVGGAAELEYMESYIDIDKIRVLVFDKDDKFLFESKSRWVKQLDPSSDHQRWTVSVPLYNFGNDKDYDWEFEKIRTKLTTEEFKIAILANRPEREWNMGIKPRTSDDQEELDPDAIDPSTGQPYGWVVPGGWFGSTGPDWRRNNSVVYSGTDKVVKDVFDLHHCQYDPIYHGKNYYTAGDKITGLNKNTNQDFYSCIAGAENNEADYDPERPYMGATSSWVEWGTNDDVKDSHGWFRVAKMPSEDHPIPMYGIQKFSALTNWKKGTPINLSRKTGEDGAQYNDLPVSLLRSVVKVEVVVPTGTINDAVIFYPNLYARCEPMDVWTPTNEIWVTNHSDCEWKDIKGFGLMVRSEDSNYADYSIPIINESRIRYQDRLSRLYGIWRKEKNWSFNKNTNEDIDSYFDEGGKYADDNHPRIFNPCIQRNTTIYVEKAYTDGDGDHYIAYVGERNMNHPSNIGRIGDTGAGACPVMYWCLIRNGNTLSFPIAEYTAANYNKMMFNGTASATPGNSSTGFSTYEKGIVEDSRNYPDLPVPLLRNHVYKIRFRGANNGDFTSTIKSRSNGFDGFSIQSEILATKDIGFGN
ncbi:MAG: hypothetical protein J1E38_03135 [Paramuribaculum sp.]|nr:hypothetical protein [Paramuribaculum sp.]